MPSLFDLVGIADNSGEPEPLLNKTSVILGLCITFQAWAWVCVTFRLYTRLAILKLPWWDDLFVFLSLVSRYTCMFTPASLGHFSARLTPIQR